MAPDHYRGWSAEEIAADQALRAAHAEMMREPAPAVADRNPSLHPAMATALDPFMRMATRGTRDFSNNNMNLRGS